MSEEVEIDVDGKGSIRIPKKLILITLGLIAAALGLGEDVFQTILDTVEG